MKSKTDRERSESVEVSQPDANEAQQQINMLTQKLLQSEATLESLRQELRGFEKQRKSLNSWLNKIPFVLILLSFIAVGFASYFYPTLNGVDWLWHGKPTEVAERFLEPLEGESSKMVMTLAIWVAYAVLWQIFVLVNVTDMVKYLHVYSSRKFRFLARLTLLATLVGGCFMLLLCIHASNLVESVLEAVYPIKWLFTSIIMVVPLVGALMLSGGRPLHLDD